MEQMNQLTSYSLQQWNNQQYNKNQIRARNETNQWWVSGQTAWRHHGITNKRNKTKQNAATMTAAMQQPTFDYYPSNQSWSFHDYIEKENILKIITTIFTMDVTIRKKILKNYNFKYSNIARLYWVLKHYFNKFLISLFASAHSIRTTAKHHCHRLLL